MDWAVAVECLLCRWHVESKGACRNALFSHRRQNHANSVLIACAETRTLTHRRQSDGLAFRINS